MSSGKTQVAKLSLDEKVRLFRKRFAVREDVFLEKTTYTVKDTNPETGETIRKDKNFFMPVCRNHMNPSLCLIAQRKGTCTDCSNKVYEQLTDSWLRQHIVGNRILCLIPNTPDGTKLGAIDFDEAISGGLMAIYEDAVKVKEFCATLGIHSYIARSSNKGYHLYFWFENWIPAHHFTSFASYVLIKTGFGTRLEAHGMKMPEVFPKQTIYSSKDVGNGIRAPLSEPDMKNGKNCFVNEKGEPYPLSEQWKIFADMKENSVENFNAVLKEKEVPIYEAPMGRTGIQRKRAARDAAGNVIKDKDGNVVLNEENEVTAIEKRGSFWNVVAACPAMQEYWAKGENGQYEWDNSNPNGLFHKARLASMNLAIATKDGEEVLRKRWPGAKTDNAIHGAVNHGYKPASCRYMQAEGVCRIGKHPKYGNHCFKRLPPVHYENGKLVTNPENLPEDSWPDPSPIRYATENNLTADEVCERFKLLIKAKKREFDASAANAPVEFDEKKQPIINADESKFTPDNTAELISNLVERTVRLSLKDRERVTTYIFDNKIFTKTEWNQRLKAAGASVNEEKKREVKTGKSFIYRSRTYFLDNDSIKTMYIDAKGIQHEDEFSNYWIERVDEPAIVRLMTKADGREISLYEDRWYNLVIHVGGQSKAIKILNKVYSNANAFFEAVRAAGGSGLIGSTSKEAYDVMMAAITHFSEPQAEIHSLRDMGYHRLRAGVRYITPSVIITADEIAPNNTYLIEFTDDYTKGIDFRILSEEEMKEVTRSIVADYFNCNNPTITMACFGHAMAAVCTDAIAEVKGWRKSPVLWLAGDFAGGKSFVLENAQFFFGDFAKQGNIGAGGSFKAKIGVANSYRHAFLSLDDHKDSTQNDRGRGIVQFVQSAYDRNVLPALQRDGKNREHASRVRGLIGVSGEDFPDKEASAVSRLILIDVRTKKKLEEGRRVLEKRALYRGFTPYVVRHVLQMTPETVAALWNQLFEQIYEGSQGADEKESASRICENLTLNLFGFRVALDCMIAHGGLSSPEAEKLAAQHLTNLRLVKINQTNSVKEARASEVFINDLGQLLADPRKYRIHGWAATDLDDYKNAETLGFYKEAEPDVVFLYPELAYKAVANLARQKNTNLQSQSHVARQLFEDGYLVERLINRKAHRYQCQRRGPNHQSVRLYPIRSEALGFDRLSGKAGENELEKKTPTLPKNTSSEDEFVLE